jgi:hypothetical protein
MSPVGESESGLGVPGEGMGEDTSGEILAEDEWESDSSTTASLGEEDAGSNIEQMVVEVGESSGSSEGVMVADTSKHQTPDSNATSSVSKSVPLPGHNTQVPKLPRYVLSIPEKVLVGETAASRRKFARKHFSLFGAVISVRHVHSNQADDDDVEVEYATSAFLERALLKEVVSGVYPTRVTGQLDPLAPTATVKVLGIPHEATSQDLRNAMVHYGTIQSVRLTPTLSGAGMVGYVSFRTALSGKAALDAGYSFLGKERIRVVHPAVTKELEGSAPCFQLKLTNLPPNATDWELRGIMDVIHATNWHIPRIPRAGMTHLRCHHALVDFADSATCEQASKTSVHLRGHHLLWYQPLVATCYKCGRHGHFQVSCPSLIQTDKGIHPSTRRAGISYAAAANPQPANRTQPVLQFMHTDQVADTAMSTPNDALGSAQANAARLDTLETQIVTLSKCVQVLIERFDTITKSVSAIEEAVGTIASHAPMVPQARSTVKSADRVSVTPGTNTLSPEPRFATKMPAIANSHVVVVTDDSSFSTSAPPIISTAPAPQLPSPAISEVDRITGIEGAVKQLTWMMMTLQAQLSPVSLGSGHRGMVLSDTSYPVQAGLHPQYK